MVVQCAGGRRQLDRVDHRPGNVGVAGARVLVVTADRGLRARLPGGRRRRRPGVVERAARPVTQWMPPTARTQTIPTTTRSGLATGVETTHAPCQTALAEDEGRRRDPGRARPSGRLDGVALDEGATLTSEGDPA